MVRTVVVTTVKRASVTDPQRFSKEFNATGVWPATQRRKNCIYNEGDVVKNHLNFVKVVPITYLNFIVIVIEVSKKKKKEGIIFHSDPRIRMLPKTAHNRHQFRNWLQYFWWNSYIVQFVLYLQLIHDTQPTKTPKMFALTLYHTAYSHVIRFASKRYQGIKTNK